MIGSGRTDAERLDRVWDGVLDPGATTPGDDPALAGWLLRWQTLAAPAAPDTGFVARLREELLIMDAAPMAGRVTAPALGRTAARDRRPAVRGRGAAWRHREARGGRWWPLAEITAATAVIALLTAAAFGLRGGTPDGNGDRTVGPFASQATPVPGDPVERWRFRPAGSNTFPPVVGDGLVYVASGNRYGSFDALAAATGAIAWSFYTDGPPAAAPALGDGIVYALDRFGEVHAIGVGSGDEIWGERIGENAYGALAVGDGLVFVGAQDETALLDGSARYRVLALDAANGAERWRVEGDPGPLHAVLASGDSLYLTVGNTLRALNTGTGEERWRFQTGGSLDTVFATADTVYAGQETVVALDAADGTERWRGKLGNGPLTITGDLVVGFEAAPPRGNAASELLAVDRQTGRARWRFPIEAEDARSGIGNAAVAVAGTTAYLATQYDGLIAVEIGPTGGREAWRVPLASEGSRPPVVADGVTYVVQGDGSLVAIGGTSAATPAPAASATPVEAPTSPSRTAVGRFAVGARVTVGATGESAVVRATPGTAGVAIGHLRVGTVLTVTAKPREVDGAVWWPVRHDETGFSGFVEERFLGPGGG